MNTRVYTYRRTVVWVMKKENDVCGCCFQAGVASTWSPLKDWISTLVASLFCEYGQASEDIVSNVKANIGRLCSKTFTVKVVKLLSVLPTFVTTSSINSYKRQLDSAWGNVFRVALWIWFPSHLLLRHLCPGMSPFTLPKHFFCPMSNKIVLMLWVLCALFHYQYVIKEVLEAHLKLRNW